MSKEQVLKNIINFEKELYVERKSLEDAKKLHEPKIKENEEYIVDMLKNHDLKEGNYFKLETVGVWKEIPIGELKNKFPEYNILNNICVSIDFEATREHLKVNGGLDDSLIDLTIENLKRKVFGIKEILKLKNEE